MIRVGFTFSLVDEGWLGGLNYFRNLFGAVLALPERKIEPIILVPDDYRPALPNDFPPVAVIRNSIFGFRSKWGRLQWASFRGFKRDLVVEAVLKWHRISVLSHSFRLGFGSRVPAIAWIPDFQHLHLPEFFSAEERAKREAAFATIVESSDRVILSSRDAEHDFRSRYPQSAQKSVVLPFVAAVGDEASVPTRETLENRYGLAGPYFLVANQFWAHKNHRLIIDALRLLKAQRTAVPVLATGGTHDYRWPLFFSDLMRHAEAQGVLDCFKVLGVLPRGDVLGLMRHAVALLNPSRFEGWNTSIEEAKALGVRVIASDIAVHREQAPPGALYVHPDRPEELAMAMSRLWAERDHHPPAPSAQSLAERRQAFARAYQKIVLEVHDARSRARRVTASALPSDNRIQ